MVVSEFVSAAGICRGNERTKDYLRFDDDERPIGIQIFGSEPAVMADAAAHVTEVYAPDFVDINFGCPVKKVVRKNGGSGCLRDLELVEDITRAVVDATPLPVTAKTRSGFDEATRDPVGIGLRIQEAGARMITLHPRTRTDMYGGQARWSEIRDLVEALEIPVVGNGDIRTGEDALRMRQETGCHGIMMARGTHGAPWLFRQARAALEGDADPPGSGNPGTVSRSVSACPKCHRLRRGPEEGSRGVQETPGMVHKGHPGRKKAEGGTLPGHVPGGDGRASDGIPGGSLRLG